MHCIFIIGYLLIQPLLSAFNENPDSTFKIDISPSTKRIVQSPDGSRFFAWNNNTNFYIYTTSGQKICSNSSNFQVMEVIWPKQYNPIVLFFPGTQFGIIQPTTCNIKQWYAPTSISGYGNMAFTKRGSINVIAFSLSSYYEFIYQFNVVNGTGIKGYTNNSLVSKIVEMQYSVNGTYLYAVEIMTNYSRRIQVFDALTGLSKNIISTTESITSIIPTNDQNYFIAMGTNFAKKIVTIYKININGQMTKLAQRSSVNRISSLPQQNVIVLTRPGSKYIEVIDLVTGNLIQNLTYFTSKTNTVWQCFLSNNSLIAVDNLGNFATSKFHPKQDQKADQGFPVWIIIVAVLGALVIVGSVLVFIKRDKLKKFFGGRRQPQEDLQEPIIDPNLAASIHEKQNRRSVQQIVAKSSILYDDAGQQRKKGSILRKQDQIKKKQQQQKIKNQLNPHQNYNKQEQRLIRQKIANSQKERIKRQNLSRERQHNQYNVNQYTNPNQHIKNPNQYTNSNPNSNQYTNQYANQYANSNLYTNYNNYYDNYIPTSANSNNYHPNNPNNYTSPSTKNEPQLIEYSQQNFKMKSNKKLFVNNKSQQHFDSSKSKKLNNSEFSDDQLYVKRNNLKNYSQQRNN